MKFWSFFRNEAKPDEVELRIDGDIVDDDDVWVYEWLGITTTSPNAFREELAKYAGLNLVVWIDSYGGNVFAATGICNALLNHKKTGASVTTIGDGKVMSAAVTIFLAGDKRKASPGCMFMIHNPLASARGYASELRKAADALDVVKETIINVYQMATGLSRNKISDMMDAETYMDARAAIKNNIATEMFSTSQVDPANLPESVMNFAFSRLDIQNAADDSMRKFLEVAKKFEATPPAPPVQATASPPPAADQPKESILAEARKLVTAMWQSLSSQNKTEREVTDLEIKNTDDLRKAFPELVNQIEEQSKTGTVQAERDRIAALDALDDGTNPTVTALVADAKASGKTADDIKNAVEIIKKNTPASAAPAPQNSGEGWLKNLATDITNSGVNGVGTEAAGGQAAAEEAEIVNYMAEIINKKTGGKR